jgi:hypothetical protein
MPSKILENRPSGKGILLSLKGRFDKRWTHTFPPCPFRDGDLPIDGDCTLRDIGIAAADFLAWAGTKHCVISMHDLDAYYESWRKLAASGTRTIFPAHGKPFPVARLHEAIGKQRKEHMVPFPETVTPPPAALRHH